MMTYVKTREIREMILMKTAKEWIEPQSKLEVKNNHEDSANFSLLFICREKGSIFLPRKVSWFLKFWFSNLNTYLKFDLGEKVKKMLTSSKDAP